MFEMREIKNKEEYNPLLVSKNAPLTQTWFYGEWQEMMGRKVRRFEVKKDSEIIGFFQTIKYPLLFEQNFLYIPHGPILRQGYEGQAVFLDFLKEFYKKLFEIGKEEKAVFVRFDPFPKTEKSLLKYFRKTPTSHCYSSFFQPKFEWILNLEKSEEKILSEMHPKTRYNINLATKRGIKTEIINETFSGYFNNFYKLLEETAKRDNFKLHPKIYYENIFGTLDSNNAFLATAKYNSKVLAINLVLLFGGTAHFLFGGSSDEYKNLMAPHLAHWEVIKESRQRGFKTYNFGAVGPDKFGGISRFKKGFGGELIEYSDSYDLILKPFWHWLYNIRKKLQSYQKQRVCYKCYSTHNKHMTK